MPETLDLGSVADLVLLLLILAGIAKWKLPELRGSRTAALVLGIAVTLSLVHALLIPRWAIAAVIEDAVMIGILAAGAAMGAASVVRGPAKRPAPD